MKKEIPPAAIVATIIVGVLVLAGVWMMAGGTGQMSPADQKLAEQQSKVQEERAMTNLGVSPQPSSDPNAQGSAQGLSGEAAARAQHPGSGQSGQ